jgi:hypothetical protein
MFIYLFTIYLMVQSVSHTVYCGMAGSLVNSMFVCVCMNIMCAHTYIDTYASQQGGVYVCTCV